MNANKWWFHSRLNHFLNPSQWIIFVGNPSSHVITIYRKVVNLNELKFKQCWLYWFHGNSTMWSLQNLSFRPKYLLVLYQKKWDIRTYTTKTSAIKSLSKITCYSWVSFIPILITIKVCMADRMKMWQFFSGRNLVRQLYYEKCVFSQE